MYEFVVPYDYKEPNTPTAATASSLPSAPPAPLSSSAAFSWEQSPARAKFDFKTFQNKKIDALHVTSWNCPGLCMSQVRSKFAELKPLLEKSSVICLQETHDDGAILDALVTPYGFINYSNSGGQNWGGTNI